MDNNRLLLEIALMEIGHEVEKDGHTMEDGIKKFNELVKNKTLETSENQLELVQNIVCRLDILSNLLLYKGLENNPSGFAPIAEEMKKEIAKIELLAINGEK